MLFITVQGLRSWLTESELKGWDSPVWKSVISTGYDNSSLGWLNNWTVLVQSVHKFSNKLLVVYCR